MKTMNPILANAKKIALFRALQLGDLLCAIPAIRALRAALPNAEITLLGLPWAKALIERFPQYLDNFIHFPGYMGLPEQPFDATEWHLFKEQIKERQFDVVLQMQGNGSYVNQMLETLDIKKLAGFHSVGNYMDEEWFMEYPNAGSEIDRHLLLMEHLGIPSKGRDLEFPILEKDKAELHNLLLPLVDKKYVCVHPGSRGSWRQWPPACFAGLADFCIEKGYTVVITGTKEEALIVEEVLKCMKHAAIDISGKTSLGAVGLLIKNACMLISNCTGVAHVASALATPSIVISMDGEPERWGPLNRKIHHVIDWTQEKNYEHVFRILEQMLEKDSLLSV